MMSRLRDRRQVRCLSLLLAFAYMTSYITRINFGAIISEMESATGLSRTLLSMSVTGSFITYGAGQVVSGVLGDRISPKKLVSMGFVLTVMMNFTIPFCGSPYLMLALWCVNGFAQSLMWPPMVKIMTSLLSPEDYKKTVVIVSCGSSVGTILVYLLSPVLIAISGWKAVFWSCAVCGAVMLLVWNTFALDAKPETSQTAQHAKTANHMLFTPMMLSIMAAIILMGMLRDGVTTWMPSYISETYHLSNVISILTGVVLPVFSMVCFMAASKVYGRVFKSPVLCAGVIFAVGAVASAGVYLLSGESAVFSVVFSALLTGAMHGVNLMLISMVPPFFKKYGNVSTVSGVVNACTYIGSAISTWGIAFLSEKAGWNVTLLLWIGIAVLGTAICFAVAKPWNRKML